MISIKFRLRRGDIVPASPIAPELSMWTSQHDWTEGSTHAAGWALVLGILIAAYLAVAI